MLNATSQQLAELNRTVTSPCFLVQVGYGPQEFCSTRESTVTTLGNDWVPNVVQVSSMADFQRAIVVMNNADRSLTQSAVQGDWRNAVCDIWFCLMTQDRYDPEPYVEDGYVEEGYVARDAFYPQEVLRTYKLFSGELSSVDNIGATITFTAQRRKLTSTYTPNVNQVIQAPLANHLPANGTVFEWDGETYVIGTR